VAAEPVANTTARGQVSSLEANLTGHALCSLRDGKIDRVSFYTSHEAALEAGRAVV
jgi:ketosteroid isomerase-like protein